MMESSSEAESDGMRPILLGGEDDMEEDENVPSLPPTDFGDNVELLSSIITPSPYTHHMTGATASRFRNAMSRVTTDPTSDVEAWQALITEANACYRNIFPSLHSVDADTHAKLDWIESCYGNLLKHFPYASAYYVSIVEMLLAQSARVGEEEGPLIDYGMDRSRRALQCEAKVESVFRKVLGIEMDGTPVQDAVGGMCTSSIELWLLYVRKRIRDAYRHAETLPSMDEQADLIRQWTIKAYEVAISHASFVYNNHMIWKQYVTSVRSWVPNPLMNSDHALAQKQMLHLRAIYQRLVTHPMTGLDQLWQEYEAFERGQSEALAAALISEFAPKYQHARSIYLERNRVYNVMELQMGRLATPPVDEAEEEYLAKMEEENSLLTLWKKRCSYERTNPERLTSSELVERVRQAYKEMACTLTRHPEVWHMWSMWELLRPGASEKVEYAVAVLQRAQEHIPDCTLLAYAEAQVVELYTSTPSECMGVMERFLERSPNTLGFVLHQQMVRRYNGIQAARLVFAKARRVLLEYSATIDTKTDQTTPETKEVTKESTEGESGITIAGDAADVGDVGKRRMVTNRLDPDVGVSDRSSNPVVKTAEAESSDNTDEDVTRSKATPGIITWQLYASHANMEHRLNHAPTIAARIYELGLRKHVSFLTKPPYVLRYAQVLLELQDTENLRALLTRSVAACEGDQDKGDAVAALWDMTLRFEANLSGMDASNVSAFYKVERRRRAALMGTDLEDVATGGIVGVSDPVVGIGAHKSTIAEQLIRSEGYDVSSNIVNGMSRTVDVLEVMGVWGNGEREAAKRTLKPAIIDKEDSMAGGKSDAGFQRRLHFQSLAAAGVSMETAMATDTSGSKILSARERLQQAATPSLQAGAATIAIQQSPEWLRPFLLLLPASRFRTAAMNKPPPHMIEMVLSALRTNALPVDRPSEEARANDPRKRRLETGGDSSDEENGIGGGGGYGSQFRARQRSHQMGESLHANGVDGPATHQRATHTPQ